MAIFIDKRINEKVEVDEGTAALYLKNPGIFTPVEDGANIPSEETTEEVVEVVEEVTEEVEEEKEEGAEEEK